MRARSALDKRMPGMIPISSIRARTSSLVIFFSSPPSIEDPRAHRLPQLFQRREIGSYGLAIGELRGAVTALRIEKIEKGQGAAPVSILADIPASLGGLKVAGLEELGDPCVLLAG